MAYKNKEDQREYAKQHYLDNKEVYKERAKLKKSKDQKRNRKYITEYLLNHPCVDCGNTDIIVLDFDHVRGKKEINISDTVNKAWSIKRIQKEIDKCEIRCANCHRKITHLRRLEKLMGVR